MYVRVGIHWWLSVYLLHLFISMYLHVVMEVGPWDSGLGCRSSIVWNMFIGYTENPKNPFGFQNDLKN